MHVLAVAGAIGLALAAIAGPFLALESSGLEAPIAVPDDAAGSLAPPGAGGGATPEGALPLAPVLLCVLDTGARVTHEALAPFIVGGKDFVDGDEDVSDEHGHGTKVAGRAIEAFLSTAGPGSEASLGVLIGRVANETGRYQWANLTAGINWCVGNGADVISISLGDPKHNEATAAALGQARQAGALVVAAGGNDGPCQACLSYPARDPNVLAVGCVGERGAVCAISSAGDELDLVAPGFSVLAPSHASDSARARMTGTSMAAPFVAALALAAFAGEPGLTHDEVTQRLIQGAEDLGPAGWDPVYGFGLAGTSLLG